MNEQTFRDIFEKLTGNPPLSWQKRLFLKHFDEGTIPPQLDIPTGLGKTMVMAIWLIARAQHPKKMPTRLVYVVDRRTVVDQATDLAMLLRTKAAKVIPALDGLSISTLRGQLADNREWSRDPSRPAIIIGTVDLIGSALLFSGYRSSYKRRPLEAGLLGQDSLLVLDEAHLSKPFEKLVMSIEREGTFQKNRDDKGKPQGMPIQVIRMSATNSNSTDHKSFTLQFDGEGYMTDGDAKDKTIVDRFGAKKQLTIEPPVEKKTMLDKIAKKAIELAEKGSLCGKRIVVFVKKPEDAKTVADKIRKHKTRKTKAPPYVSSVEVLTGTMRGLERDELVEKSVFKKRWLNGDLKPDDPTNKLPVFLISTSAGEVGFDLNADHMVCDATTIDSLIQRLGRVNRRGLGDAQVHLLVEPVQKGKDGKPKKLEGLGLAIANTLALLKSVTDVSPKNIAALKMNGWKDKYAAACSPEPATVELTDILLDAWSMTSITEPMPGRPEVGPWLRGIAEWEPPQTTIAWRAELDLESFADLDHDDIEEWFDTHRVLTHETLSEKTSDVATWFKDRWKAIPETQQRKLRKRLVVIDRVGITVVPLDKIIDWLNRKGVDADAFLRNAEIVVPVSFGGIRSGVGLLDPAEPKLDKGEEKKPAEERETILKDRQDSIDVADVRGRYRETSEKPEGGERVATSLIPNAAKPTNGKYARYALELASDDDRIIQLISYVPRREKREVGSKPQILKEHVSQVRGISDQIINSLRLTADDPARIALQLAADYHDHGKDRERWQRLLVFPKNFVKPDEPMGKSGGEMRHDPRGYRHEFGSLREFTDAFNAGKLLDDNGVPISREVVDLAAHLIAAHHGRARPHFPKGGFDPLAESCSDEIHTESIRRFARLQRKYGWWRLAWLENLLRCADAMASADQDADDTADSEGDQT